jgi:hypothetical protein
MSSTTKRVEASPQNHTPGPWQLETVKTQVGVCHKIGKLGSSTKLNYACLYDDCYSAEPRDLQLLADARLIAAAPDTYKELASSTAILVMLCMWRDQPLKPEAFAAMEDQIKLNRAAIAKAVPR